MNVFDLFFLCLFLVGFTCNAEEVLQMIIWLIYGILHPKGGFEEQLVLFVRCVKRNNCVTVLFGWVLLLISSGVAKYNS